ncbi:GCK [Trema orientale]|uniref:GCK n=1 Tax=Trema orientale TaxID=63057 RepID=A0A2P5G0E2_TREOI|nr:GCK [Trema orientale]
MSDSDSKTSESKTLENPTQPSDRPVDAEPREEEKLNSDSGGEEGEKEGGGEEEEEEEEEEGECGFCLFMKGGGCRESFIAWENCIEEAEKNKEDIVEKCFQVTGALKKCMEAHADYYEPILRAEKAAEEEAFRELEKEAAAKDSELNAAPENSEQQGVSAEKRDA